VSGTPPVPGHNHILAIDGPAGAGKSTVAAHMARRFNLLNIETGAMYRAFALKALATGTALNDAGALAQLSKTTCIEFMPAASGNRILLDTADVTDRLRTHEITQAASRVSVHAPVRAWMVRLQQGFGAQGLGAAATQGLVMEGRDVGTVIFPQASIKIFLFASPEARTGRRLAQDGNSLPESSQAILAAIRERDERDRSRVESPLRPADDAVQLDSTHLTLEQVMEQIAQLVTKRWDM